MPITAFYHDDLAVRVHKIFGAIAPAEFRELAAFYDRARRLLAGDLINLVEQDTAGMAFTADDLADLRAIFRALHMSSDFMVIRRSAWVCPNVAAWPVLERWLDGRHSLDGQGTEVCLVSSIEEANCLFDLHEIATVAAWRGFRELIHIDGGADPA